MSNDGLTIVRDANGIVHITAAAGGKSVRLRVTPRYAEEKAAELLFAAHPPRMDDVEVRSSRP